MKTIDVGKILESLRVLFPTDSDVSYSAISVLLNEAMLAGNIEERVAAEDLGLKAGDVLYKSRINCRSVDDYFEGYGLNALDATNDVVRRTIKDLRERYGKEERVRARFRAWLAKVEAEL